MKRKYKYTANAENKHIYTCNIYDDSTIKISERKSNVVSSFNYQEKKLAVDNKKDRKKSPDDLSNPTNLGTTFY